MVGYYTPITNTDVVLRGVFFGDSSIRQEYITVAKFQSPETRINDDVSVAGIFVRISLASNRECYF
ncbi:MAG: hypothetical protein ACRD5J_18080 [Nitrososphaeraceae archaeon]